NINASPTAERAFQPSPLTAAPLLTELSDLTDREFAATFHRSPIRRAKHAGFVRNVRVALKNLSPVVSSCLPISDNTRKTPSLPPSS
ncbi:MAG: hypothetical protein ACREIL_05975, partial [Nitrospiraceae bacterium]